jgi:hypothetical protein
MGCSVCSPHASILWEHQKFSSHPTMDLGSRRSPTDTQYMEIQPVFTVEFGYCCCDDNPLTEFSTNGMLCMLTTCLHFVGTSEESIPVKGLSSQQVISRLIPLWIWAQEGRQLILSIWKFPLTEFSTNGMLCMLTTCLHFVGTSEESIRGEYHPFLEDSDCSGRSRFQCMGSMGSWVLLTASADGKRS